MIDINDFDAIRIGLASSKQIRGGSWFSPPRGVAAGRRDGWDPVQAKLDVGFRCVREAP